MLGKMAIHHSTSRSIFGCKTEDIEEGERPIHPVLLDRERQNHCSFNGYSICNVFKGLLQKFCYLFCLPIRPRKKADSLLPIRNPAAPSLSTEPLLVQSTLISSPSNDSSEAEIAPAAFAFVDDLNTDEDEELQCVCENIDVDVLSSQQWQDEQNYSANKDVDVVVSIPNFTCSLAYATANEEVMRSAVVIEENAPRIIPFVEEDMGMNSNEDDEEEEREEVKIKSIVVVSEERWIKHEEEREEVKIKSIVGVSEERWIKHYSSRHRILLVGEGDFSFSACLALAFGSASNITATSLDSEAFLKQNYRRAPSNIKKLWGRGGKVMHEIDATKMANHESLGQFKFDRIIFNFPYAGLASLKNLPRKSKLRRHRRLVSLFLKNAREMISENGEIHISHKTNEFHLEFQLESIASSHGLRLIEEVKFNHRDYQGYRTKCGFGGDNFFNCNPSKTYKFGLKMVQYCYLPVST